MISGNNLNYPGSTPDKIRPHNRAKNLEVQYFKVVSITMKLILIFAFVSSFGILTLLAEKIITVTL